MIRPEGGGRGEKVKDRERSESSECIVCPQPGRDVNRLYMRKTQEVERERERAAIVSATRLKQFKAIPIDVNETAAAIQWLLASI